jgi:hypothetical protein
MTGGQRPEILHPKAALDSRGTASTLTEKFPNLHSRSYITLGLPLTCLVILLFLLIIPSSGIAQMAQGTYRFKVAPQFLLLDLYYNKYLLGWTASFVDDKRTNFVIGQIIEKDKINLSVYPMEAFNKLLQNFREVGSKRNCKRSVFQWSECDLVEMLETIPSLGFLPHKQATYLYRKYTGRPIGDVYYWPTPVGEWQADQGKEDPYSTFYFVDSYEIANIESLISSSTLPKSAYFETSFRRAAMEKLFGYKIVRFIAGVPGASVAFRNEYCPEVAKTLPGVFARAGHWEVNVRPEDYRSFRILLKSHAAREFFYADGYWWKVFFEIRFSENNDVGMCSGAKVYLYDSVVCGAPPERDPDREDRSQCFQRIDFGSKAEYEMRDRIVSILQEAYGRRHQPPAGGNN